MTFTHTPGSRSRSMLVLPALWLCTGCWVPPRELALEQFEPRASRDASISPVLEDAATVLSAIHDASISPVVEGTPSILSAMRDPSADSWHAYCSAMFPPYGSDHLFVWGVSRLSLRAYSVQFAKNSTELPPNPIRYIDQILARPVGHWIVWGFASASERAPRSLSRRRAEVLRDWLLRQGAPANDLFVQGMGVPDARNTIPSAIGGEQSAFMLPLTLCGRDRYRWNGRYFVDVHYSGDREVDEHGVLVPLRADAGNTP